MLTGIIIGACAMSVCTLIALILNEANHNKLAFVFCGPAVWVFTAVGSLILWIQEKWHHRDLRALLVCPDGKIRYIKSKRVETMRECADRDYEFPNFSELGADANLWKKEYRWREGDKVGGNLRYSPKAVWSKYEPISDEDYFYALSHPFGDAMMK